MFDRALQSLPITQHERVWKAYVPFAKGCGVPETAVKVYRRYLQLAPEGREEFIDFLQEQGLWGEAAAQLAMLVNDPKFVSATGKSSHALWMQLCSIVSQHPAQVAGLNVEAIIRSGLRRFTDEVGRLWCALADYFIRLGEFERARDVYEEGVQAVITVRDFAMLFDAYSQFEETLLTAKMKLAGEEPAQEEPREGEGLPSPPADPEACLAQLQDMGAGGDDVELRLRRMELLMDRRPVLLSSVVLRQNPHNVVEWHKRAKLFLDQGRDRSAVLTYTEAVKTVNVKRAVGKPHTLWVSFAELYEKAGDLDSARVVFSRAVAAPARSSEDLAALFLAWAEMEMRAEEFEKARAVMARAVKRPTPAEGKPVSAAAAGVHRIVSVWSLFLDLEENLGTLESVKAAYERCIDLKVATPEIVCNFASYLKEKAFFEDSFRAYEKGISVFGFPHARELWITYINSFVERYGGSKLERLRELCESSVRDAPAEHAAPLYLLYASLEEKYGRVRRALAVYQRAAATVPPNAKYEVYLQYIARTSQHLGLTATRPVFEEAVGALPDKHVKDMCLRFAAMEKSLGEVDRARAVLAHAAHFADPRLDKRFWNTWHDFEVEHGNADTYKDMRRVQRSVELAFASSNVNTEAMAADSAPAISDAQLESGELGDVARALGGIHPAAAAELGTFAGHKRGREPETAPAAGAAAASADPLQALEAQTARIAAATGGVRIEERAVPQAVFGSAAPEYDAQRAETEAAGAHATQGVAPQQAAKRARTE